MNHGLKLHPDGTLEITMPKDKEVTRVLVCQAGTQNGKLYYPEINMDTKLIAEVKMSKEDIQDAVDKAVKKMKAELGPCDFCKHKDDCGYMAIYCPSERRTDE